MRDAQEQRLTGLRQMLPNAFEDHDDVLDESKIFPIDLNRVSILDQELAEDIPSLNELDPFPEEIVPGRNIPDDNGATDSLAFYLPYHFYDKYWGVYIKPEGVQHIRAQLKSIFNTFFVSSIDQVRFAKQFLYAHECYHNKLEGFATSLQLVNFKDRIFIDCFFNEYKKQFYSSAGSIEETCANSFAREEVLKKLDEIISYQGDTKAIRKELRSGLNEFFSNQPPGYRDASITKTRSPDKVAELLNSYSRTLSHQTPRNSHLYNSTKNNASAWEGTQFPSSYTEDLIRKRVFWFIPSGSKWASNAYHAKYPNLKKRKFFKQLRKMFGIEDLPGGKHSKLVVPPEQIKIPYTNKRDWVEDYLIQQVSDALKLKEEVLLKSLGIL